MKLECDFLILYYVLYVSSFFDYKIRVYVEIPSLPIHSKWNSGVNRLFANELAGWPVTK